MLPKMDTPWRLGRQVVWWGEEHGEGVVRERVARDAYGGGGGVEGFDTSGCAGGKGNNHSKGDQDTTLPKTETG